MQLKVCTSPVIDIRCLFCRINIKSLRRQLQKPSQAVPVNTEAVWIWAACDGDEDLDGSGRDAQQSSRATRPSF